MVQREACCGVDICAWDAEGFAPVAEYGGWRVALMRASEAYQPENLTTLQKHNETDEVFVLLSGLCILVLSDEEAPQSLTGIRLLPGRVYNVRKGVWHTHYLSKDAAVLVVENRDTSKENSPRVPVPYPVKLKALRYPLEEGL